MQRARDNWVNLANNATCGWGISTSAAIENCPIVDYASTPPGWDDTT